jgi:hypothetical protein
MASSPTQTRAAQPPPAVNRPRTFTAKAIAEHQRDRSKLQSELDGIDQQLSELHARSPWPEERTQEYYEQKRLESSRQRLLIRMDEKDLKIKTLAVKQNNFWSWWVQFGMIGLFATLSIHSSGFSWGGSYGSACLIAFFAITLFRILDGCQRILNLLVLNEARKEADEQGISIPAARENLEQTRAL